MKGPLPGIGIKINPSMVTLDHEVVGNGQTLTGTNSDLFSRKERFENSRCNSGGILTLSLTGNSDKFIVLHLGFYKDLPKVFGFLFLIACAPLMIRLRITRVISLILH